jgi:hypothetical protein
MDEIREWFVSVVDRFLPATVSHVVIVSSALIVATRSDVRTTPAE